MSVNYDRVCRLCLSSRGELLPIFPTTSSDDSEPAVLASKIKDCVSVQISENDELPTNVCKKCMDNVNNWHIFKSVCERAQNKLESLFNKDGSLLEEVKIKNEPFSDEAYDDGVLIDGSYPDPEHVGPSHKLQPEGPPILASLGLTPRSDKTNVDPRMDWHRVHAILDMVQDDDVIDTLQSTEECDVLHVSDHDSETDVELLSDVDDQYTECTDGYICKDKKILSKTPMLSTTAVNNRARDVMKLRKRKVEYDRHLPQPKHAWQQLFTDDLLELIVSSTNARIMTKHKKTKCTNANEIKTLCGILYLHGVTRPTHNTVKDLWHLKYGITCIKNAMELERFRFLLQNMSFDEDDDDTIQLDIMRRIRKVFEIFAMNCRTAFEIDSVAVIDEVVVPVYGPCPFRYSIDKKPLKRGIKMVLLVDSTNLYINNIDIITDPYFGAEEIVTKTVQHLAGSSKTIIMDKWFISNELMMKLRNDYMLYTVAALASTSDIIPPLFLTQYRKNKFFMTGFLDHESTLTSYVNSECKSVNVITNEPQFYKRGHVNLNTAVSMYKKNQSAVEVVDVLMHYYTTMQYSNDWTMSIFFTLLNIAAVNAQVLWSSYNSANIVQRRHFLKELAISLLTDELLVTLNDNPSVACDDSLLVRQKPAYKNRRRCKICVKTTKRDRRTKVFCVKCNQYICKEHTVNICTMCVG